MEFNKKMIAVIYPESDLSLLKKVKPPLELKDYINKLEKVTRFNHQKYDHPGMINDNTKIHTLRCIFRASGLPFAHPKLVRTIWVHDIPEHLVEADLSAVERFHNPQKAKEMEEQEKSVAREVLDNDDFALYESFSTAEDFLRRGGKVLPANQQALVANTIDLLDGNLVYVYYTSQWLSEHDYLEEGFAANDYTYPLAMRKSFLSAVANPAVAPEIRKAVQFLFQSYLMVAGNLWKLVDINKIPEVMRPEVVKVIRMANC